jgi:hypothetical protein
MTDDFVNGYIERKQNGLYEGKLSIEGILLPSISAVYFEDDGENYLWIKRKKILEYDFESQTYKEREARPQFEAYLKKQVSDGAIAYKGEFVFMRFKFSITGVWDKILGMDKKRLNLFVERLPMSKQTIINSINESRRKNDRGRDKSKS